MGMEETVSSNHSVFEIASAQNKTFKRFRSLLNKKYREIEKCFLMEGQRYVDTAIDNQFLMDAIIVSEQFWNEQLDEINKTRYLAKSDIYVLSKALFQELTQTEQSQGILGVFSYFKKDEKNLEAQIDHFGCVNLLFLDRIQDPGNMGTIIRTADAAGIQHILLSKGSVDPYNPKVIRSTAGSILNVNLYELEDSELAISMLKSSGFHLVVTALEDSKDYDDLSNYTNKNCLVIGNEANGVSDSLLKSADSRVKIPILGGAESLNAAIAAGIMMYKIQSACK